MGDLLDRLSLASAVTRPIVVVLILGIPLARAGLLTAAFIEGGSKLGSARSEFSSNEC